MAPNTYFMPGNRTPFVKTGTALVKETPLTLSSEVMKAMREEALSDLIVWGAGCSEYLLFK